MNQKGLASGAQISIGFVTALVETELVTFEKVLETKGWVELNKDPKKKDPKLLAGSIRQWKKTIRNTPVLAYSVAIADMGQAASALETFMFMTRCTPNELYLAGIAGSLYEEKVHKADVIIGTGVWWRTQNRIFGEDGCDKYRFRNHKLSAYSQDTSRQIQVFVQNNFGKRTRHEAEIENWNVWAGEIYTWDYVVDSGRVTTEINKSYPEALCVEMEAGGFLSAIDRFSKVNTGSPAGLEGNSDVKGFVVRGVSDYAARKDKHVNIREAASRNAADVAIDFAEYRVGTALDKRMAAAK